MIKGNWIAIDTETTGLDVWHGDEPFAVSMFNEDGEWEYFEWPVDPWTRVVIPNEEELEQVADVLQNPKTVKVFHNAKFDVRILQQAYGIETRGRIEDTMFAAHVANSQEPSLKLKFLARKYLHYPQDDEEELKKEVRSLRRKAKKLGWELAFVWNLADDGTWKAKAAVEADCWMPRAFAPESRSCQKYCVSDTERTAGLKLLYDSVFAGDSGLSEVYERELELWHTTFRMEQRGVRVRMETVEEEIEDFQKQMAHWHEVLMRAAWPGFNVGSSPDLRKLVYDKLQLPVRRRTPKTQEPQVDINALAEYMDHPVVEALFRYRACHNGLVNFFQKYKKLAVREGNIYVVHPDFQQIGPVTGRYSCRTPNLQNVANALTTRSPMPIQARTPFGPRDGYVWFSIDYSQLEVRIFADVSGEPSMLKALHDGLDMHTACTNKAWGGEGNPAMRRAAVHALELDGSTLREDVEGAGISPKVAEIWKELEVKPSNVASLDVNRRAELADEWCKRFDYDIVAAEKSLGKKTSRAKAKMILFAKIFGGGPGAIMDLLGCTYEEAAGFLADYDVAFPVILEYIHTLSNQAYTDGFIINRFGRRLGVRADKAYRAVNYMVQGSAAELLKRAMRRVDSYLLRMGLDAQVLMTIHDELMLGVRLEHTWRSMLREVCRLMEDHGGAFNIDTPVEIKKVTYSWNAKEPAIIGDWHGKEQIGSLRGARLRIKRRERKADLR